MKGRLAGPVRFELTMLFSTPVFKTGAFNRSATDPGGAHDSTVARGCISGEHRALKLIAQSVSLNL